MIKQIEKAVEQIRQSKPLIINLTNYVSMDLVSNSLLALGAAPIMTCCFDELEELIAVAACININIGTLDKPFVEKCLQATELAQRYNKPIVFDPVGAGATTFRTETAINLMQHASIVKGNASEIMALATMNSSSKGVESTHSSLEAQESAIDLARRHKCTIIVSGSTDFITDGLSQAQVLYGADLMTRVTGMGCALAAVVAAFRACIENSFKASVMATNYFGLCGALAACDTHYPGTFRTHFIDYLYKTDYENMQTLFLDSDNVNHL